MDLIFRHINDVKVILAQLLQVTEISLTHSVTSAEGRSLELIRADLGDVMSQLAPYSIF
jgi:hypothetical protein